MLEYINEDGFVTIKPDAPHIPGDGNGWLQTGVAIATGESPSLLENIPLLLQRCRKSDSCPLIWRSPWKRTPDDHQKCDDYWGALPLNKEWAKEVLAWGRSNGWSFDVREIGGIDYFFPRFIPFVPFLKHCAGEELNWFDRAQVHVSIALDAIFIGSADSNMKAYCVIKRLEAVSPKMSAWWRSRIRKRYGTVGKSWAAYFGEGHPLNDYAGD